MTTLEEINNIFQKEYKNIVRNTAFKYHLTPDQTKEKLHDVYLSIYKTIENNPKKKFKDQTEILRYIYSSISNECKQKLPKYLSDIQFSDIDDHFDIIEEEIKETYTEDLIVFFYDIMNFLNEKVKKNLLSEMHFSIFKYYLHYNLSSTQIANRTGIKRSTVIYAIDTVLEILQTEKEIMRKIKEYNLFKND